MTRVRHLGLDSNRHYPHSARKPDLSWYDGERGDYEMDIEDAYGEL